MKVNLLELVRVRINYVDADGYLRELEAEVPHGIRTEDLDAYLPEGARVRYGVRA